MIPPYTRTTNVTATWNLLKTLTIQIKCVSTDCFSPSRADLIKQKQTTTTMDGWMSLFEKGSPPFFGQCSKESFFLWDFGPAKIIEVTEAEKKSSSHPSAEVSFQSKRKKRESREAPPPLLRLLSGQPSSKTYALLRNGLTVITLLRSLIGWLNNCHGQIFLSC